MPAHYVRVTEPKVIEVRVDDAWLDGTLEAWRREGDLWLAFVRYRTEPGSTFLTWVDASRVRRSEEPTSADNDGADSPSTQT